MKNWTALRVMEAVSVVLKLKQTRLKKKNNRKKVLCLAVNFDNFFPV